MKKNFKRTLAKVMAVALTVSMVGVASTDADAAKKIKLSSKSISVAKGATKKVTIKNVKAKKLKKLTVKSANKKIATVKKAGKTAIKVTGKKAGKSTKVTVKVKVGKKTTKLTLKVKVTKAKKTVAPTPATNASATPAASASAAPAASASSTPAASASAAPASNAPATDAPATDAPVTDAPATTTPTAEPTEAPDMNIALTKENAPEWATNGGYNNAVFNADGTVSYTTDYAQPDKDGNIGSVYCNGIAFYVDGGNKKNISGHKYIALTINTTAEVVLLTWSGAADAASYWDKKDNWGASAASVDNGDGTKTVYYEVSKVMAKAEKASAIGFGLKATDYVGEYTGEEPYATKTAELSSIVLTSKIKEKDPVVSTPDIETKDLDIAALTTDFASDVDITAEDAATIIQFSKNNQRVFFDIPDNINLAQLKEIVISANVPGQLSISVFNNKFEKSGQWWNDDVYTNYPFWKGSSSDRAEDGAFGTAGDETQVYEVTPKTEKEWKKAGNGGYFSIGVNGVPEDGSDFADATYKIYSVKFVIDNTVDAVEDIVEPEPEPSTAPTAAPTTAPTAAPTQAPDPDTGDVEEGTLKLTATSDMKASGNDGDDAKRLGFDQFTGYPEDFDLSNYKTLTVNFKLYNGETAITTAPSSEFCGKIMAVQNEGGCQYGDGVKYTDGKNACRFFTDLDNTDLFTVNADGSLSVTFSLENIASSNTCNGVAFQVIAGYPLELLSLTFK